MTIRMHNRPLPILPTPGLTHPRFTRLRFMGADAGSAGTAGAGDGGAGDGDQDGAGDGGDGDQGGDASGEQNGEDSAQGDASPWDDPAKAKAEIERLRRENASSRTNAKQAAADEARTEVAQVIGKALGLIKDGDDGGRAPDVEKLTRTATEAVADARAARVELAVYQRAAGHKADPVALLDSRAFQTKVADLDPTSSDFATKVDDAIKDAVKNNPKLLAQAAGASSVDHAGGTGEDRVRTPKSLNDAVAGHYGAA